MFIQMIRGSIYAGTFMALVYFMSLTLAASSTRKQRIKPPGYLGVSRRLKMSVSDYGKVSFTVSWNGGKEFVLPFVIISLQGQYYNRRNATALGQESLVVDY
jgi:hypothetical protein